MVFFGEYWREELIKNCGTKGISGTGLPPSSDKEMDECDSCGDITFHNFLGLVVRREGRSQLKYFFLARTMEKLKYFSDILYLVQASGA